MLYFEKLHGTGNDFIIFNGLNDRLPDYNLLAKNVCDRHFGIGADGMLVVEESNKAEVKMRFFNADGSEAPMCGNGIRCFSKYVYDNEIVKDKSFTVETLGGIMKPEVILENGKVTSVKVNMGSPLFSTKVIPIDTKDDEFINKEIEILGKTYNISGLVIGTIHTVLFVDDLLQVDIPILGAAIENHPLFPLKTNVNFCEIIDNENIKVFTWERGVGETLACGTGAAASAILSSVVKNTSEKLNVSVKGGKLVIEQIDETVFMTGPAVLICKGEFLYK